MSLFAVSDVKRTEMPISVDVTEAFLEMGFAVKNRICHPDANAIINEVFESRRLRGGLGLESTIDGIQSPLIKESNVAHEE
jgi:hypothetical protein